jgi:hypothetical protein
MANLDKLVIKATVLPFNDHRSKVPAKIASEPLIGGAVVVF